MTTPPGWYPDPNAVNTQRYWDGERWADQTAPAAPEKADDAGLIGAGYALTVFMPIGALVIGIIVLARGHTVHGLGILALSIIVPLILLTAIIT